MDQEYNTDSRLAQEKENWDKKLVPYSSPRICIDWYSRIAQCNKIGIIEKPKNEKSMG